MGGSVLGEGQWVWGVHEVQETNQCTEIWFESDSQQKIHTLVVTDYQQSERKPYMYIASYGLVSHIVAWFITSSVAHYCGSLFPVSVEWSRGCVQDFLIGGRSKLELKERSLFVVVVVVVGFLSPTANYFSTKLTHIFTRGSKSDVVDV